MTKRKRESDNEEALVPSKIVSVPGSLSLFLQGSNTFSPLIAVLF